MKIFTLILALLATTTAHAQTVHSDITLMDLQRLEQLKDSTGKDERSFLMRSSSLNWGMDPITSKTKKSKPVFQWLQAGYTFHTNNNLTLSENDGSMIPATGTQQRITIGARIQWEHWLLQLQPEFVSAANTTPTNFTGDPNNGNYWSRYYLYTINKIDNLTRFGTDTYQKFFPGQSRLSYQFKHISIGLSTENLWWGPGIRNSLVLTNNAPGFVHFTINSYKPIPTNIGNIEFQAIVGKLNKTPFEAEDNPIMRTIWNDGIARKPENASRTIIGYNISYHPRWTQNLFIGFAGTSYFYSQGVDANASPDLVLPFENKVSPARMGAIYLRYKMPKENTELYLEYGRANRWAAPWNIFGDTIPTGYTAGFRKLFPVGSLNKAHIALGIELTQLQLPDARIVFNPASPLSIPKTNSWYTHPYVMQGYTNEGQVMGASIGPGSNSQTINLSWIKGAKRIGLQLERVANNNDFAVYSNFSGIVGTGGADRYWVNMSYGLNLQWDIGPWLISGFYQYTNAINYRWVKLHNIFSQPSDGDRNNTRFSFSITRFLTTHR
ncbi:MAG: hypothetical protein IKD55_04990 [Sediminibacterium sp.]|nr:hypothetical protein [Sediminibacterium sp.]